MISGLRYESSVRKRHHVSIVFELNSYTVDTGKPVKEYDSGDYAILSFVIHYLFLNGRTTLKRKLAKSVGKSLRRG